MNLQNETDYSILNEDEFEETSESQVLAEDEEKKIFL